MKAKGKKKKMFREDGGATVDPATVNDSDSDNPEEIVKEMTEPSTLKGRGVRPWEKNAMRCWLWWW